MRVLFGLLCLVAPLANALQVSGQGATFEEAKQNAFRTAIEFTVGSVVTSERESNNYKLVKDEILVYSAGYVTDYKIISTIRS
jgi:predicted RNase H-like HicB family nuclease